MSLDLPPDVLEAAADVLVLRSPPRSEDAHLAPVPAPLAPQPVLR